MKQLLTMAIAAILFTSCKKETPAEPVTDNTNVSYYYTASNKSITKTGAIWYGKISIEIKNADKIRRIHFKKITNPTGLQEWEINPVNGTYSKTFGEGSDVFSGDNPFKITVNLNNNRTLTDAVYIY